METQQKPETDQEMVADRAIMWSGFVRLSTYAIVSVAVILILMALFLL